VKSIPSNLLAHYQLETTTLAHGLVITRQDATAVAFTSAQDDVFIGGVLYTASQGLEITDIETGAGFSVSNLELTTLDDGTVFTHTDIYSGRWRNSAFKIIRYNAANVTDGVDVLLTGTVGDVKVGDGKITAELRGLQQYLQQPLGSITSRTCRARLGDSRCTVNTVAYTYTGAVTGVVSTQIFDDSSRAEDDEWFSDGVLTFTSGECVGLQQKVKTFSATRFTLSLPMFPAVNVGDTYSVVAGCRKRLAEDCAGKFNNVLNFQGEPHLPGVDALSR